MRDIVSAAVFRRYYEERAKFQENLARKLGEKMATLVGNSDHSDLTLISCDGKKLPAHICIIKQRAPGFYSKYIETALKNKQTSPSISPQKSQSSRNSSPQPKLRTSVASRPLVKIPDVDYTALKFFINSIYTEDETLHGPDEAAKKSAKRLDSSGSSGSQSGADQNSNSRQESPVRKMIKSNESHESGGTFTMDISLESNTDAGTTDSSAKQEESLDIIDIEPEIQVKSTGALASCPPNGGSADSHLPSSDQSGMDLPNQIFSRPAAGFSASESSPEDVKPSPKTSFQEILEKSLTDSDSECKPVASSLPEQVLMTSFKEIAMESPSKETVDFPGVEQQVQYEQHRKQSETSPDSFNDNSSLAQITPEESFNGAAPTNVKESFNLPNRSRSLQDQMTGKFIHFDDIGPLSEAESSQTLDKAASQPIPPPTQKIFPLFIEFEKQKPIARPENLRSANQNDHADEEADQFIVNGTAGTFAQIRRRLSITSLRSVDSADFVMSPTDSSSQKEQFPPRDGEPCSKLGRDLLEMLENQSDTDVKIIADDGEINAHRCILSATCPYFAEKLGGGSEGKSPKQYKLNGFTRATVHFLLQFLYGGVTTLPEDVTVWEVASLAEQIKLEDLMKVVSLHIKAKFCHFFHKPCGACVSATLDCLPYLQKYGLNDLLQKCLQWQSKHFSRIWKTRTFANISKELQDTCYQAVLSNLSPENVIDVLLGCEKLQATLPKSTPKSGGNFESVAEMVSCISDTSVEFLSSNFDRVIVSESFLTQGRGLALNIGLLEDLLPGVIHCLTPDTGCRVLIRLYELLSFLSARITEQNSSREAVEIEWNERFANLMRRLYELCDTHLIHCAAAVVKCDSWNLLNAAMQQRIKETGLFIEIRQPRAPPPRLSSLNRTYRRSASTGTGPQRPGVAITRDRSASQQKRKSAPISESALLESETENLPNSVPETIKEKPAAELKEQKEKIAHKKTSVPSPKSSSPVRIAKQSQKTEPVVTKSQKSEAALPTTTKTSAKPQEIHMHKSPEMQDLSESAVTGLLLKLAEQAVAESAPLPADGTVSPSGTVILSKTDSENVGYLSSDAEQSEQAKKSPKIARTLTQTIEDPKILKAARTQKSTTTGGRKTPDAVPSTKTGKETKRGSSPQRASTSKKVGESISRESTTDSLKRQNVSKSTTEKKPSTPPQKEQRPVGGTARQVSGSGVPKPSKSTNKTGPTKTPGSAALAKQSNGKVQKKIV